MSIGGFTRPILVGPERSLHLLSHSSNAAWLRELLSVTVPAGLQALSRLTSQRSYEVTPLLFFIEYYITQQISIALEA